MLNEEDVMKTLIAFEIKIKALEKTIANSSDAMKKEYEKNYNEFKKESDSFPAYTGRLEMGRFP